MPPHRPQEPRLVAHNCGAAGGGGPSPPASQHRYPRAKPYAQGLHCARRRGRAARLLGGCTSAASRRAAAAGQRPTSAPGRPAAAVPRGRRRQVLPKLGFHHRMSQAPCPLQHPTLFPLAHVSERMRTCPCKTRLPCAPNLARAKTVPARPGVPPPPLRHNAHRTAPAGATAPSAHTAAVPTPGPRPTSAHTGRRSPGQNPLGEGPHARATPSRPRHPAAHAPFGNTHRAENPLRQAVALALRPQATSSSDLETRAHVLGAR